MHDYIYLLAGLFLRIGSMIAKNRPKQLHWNTTTIKKQNSVDNLNFLPRRRIATLLIAHNK